MTIRPRSFNAFIGVATFSKLMLNTARRMVYPFAPELARGLGVPLTAVTSLIAVNQATAVLGPLGALFADRYGNKPVLLFAVVLCFIGCLGIALFPLYGVVLAGLFLAGLAKSLFDPSLQAQIGSQVPYAQRGKFIGITETSWAGATLLTIPAAGFIMSHFSWQTPFKLVAILTFVCFFLLLKLAPGPHRFHGRLSNKEKETKRLQINWKTLLKNKKVVGLLIFVFFMSLANDNVFVIYGVWLESACGMSLAEIGMSTVLIGMAEFLAEGGSALFSDRIGLKKSVLMGTAATAVTYMVLPFTASGIPLILSGLGALFLFFEFTLVSSMSLGTELVPEFRAATMAAFFAVAGIGRIIGAFSGGLIWSVYGIRGICLLSGFCSVLALAALMAGTRREPNAHKIIHP
ncbi:MFS transporter [uncultured Desulfobacter sp.]|uniref:MFS transporter n=1 Tax=uncultured Desulfobacter sp. TaxID=240139 RepID=UPI0029F5A6A4|nr:MFS transporter [uncultured Desulfobacter sp.]